MFIHPSLYILIGVSKRVGQNFTLDVLHVATVLISVTFRSALTNVTIAAQRLKILCANLESSPVCSRERSKSMASLELSFSRTIPV